MELDELKKMKETLHSAVQDVSKSIQTNVSEFEKSWQEVTDVATQGVGAYPASLPEVMPAYHHPKKNWRLKQGALPTWYKARAGVRTRALSGAARVARFRPSKLN
ncbi:sec-independent translocase [mine drainage metagenome]|uniref:Sec-independent translocase n=1 Tax=mine drainage metagenome TaxID=410659 RepID=A0A1J5PHI7_9ZZZZ